MDSLGHDEPDERGTVSCIRTMQRVVRHLILPRMMILEDISRLPQASTSNTQRRWTKRFVPGRENCA